MQRMPRSRSSRRSSRTSRCWFRRGWRQRRLRRRYARRAVRCSNGLPSSISMKARASPRECARSRTGCVFGPGTAPSPTPMRRPRSAGSSSDSRMSTESSAAERGTTAEELKRLRAVVQRLLLDWEQWRSRAQTAEARARELDGALRDVTSGAVDPLALKQRVDALEQENRFLARRLDRARESAKRISARLQFLDEDR